MENVQPKLSCEVCLNVDTDGHDYLKMNKNCKCNEKSIKN